MINVPADFFSGVSALISLPESIALPNILVPVHTGHVGAPKCCMQKMEHIVANWSVHTALQTIASNIKGFASKFACKSAYAFCVNWALPWQSRNSMTSLGHLYSLTKHGCRNQQCVQGVSDITNWRDGNWHRQQPSVVRNTLACPCAFTQKTPNHTNLCQPRLARLMPKYSWIIVNIK